MIYLGIGEFIVLSKVFILSFFDLSCGITRRIRSWNGCRSGYDSPSIRKFVIFIEFSFIISCYEHTS
nr:MAG TPA: hypothetical protein [Caudoviricetes sp.]